MKKYKPGIGISLAAATLAAGTLIGSYLACRSNEKDILAIQNPRAEELHINGLRNFHMGLIITELIVLVKYRLFYAIVNDFFADGQQSLHFRMAWDILLIR